MLLTVEFKNYYNIMNENNSGKIFFDINKKSYLLAYILLFFFFCIGAHRFYTKNVLSAIILLVLFLFSIVLLIVTFCIPTNYISFIELFLATILVIWFFVDILLTQKNVAIYNTKLAVKCGLLNEKDPNITNLIT